MEPNNKCLFCKSTHVSHQLISQDLKNPTNMNVKHLCQSCYDKFFNNELTKIETTENKFIGMPLRNFLCSKEYLKDNKTTYVFQNLKREEITDFTLWLQQPILSMDTDKDNITYITLHDNAC